MIPARKKKGSGPAPVHPFDVLHGTDTGALIPGDDLATGHRHDRHITAYHGTAPSLFRKLMAQWRNVARHPLEKTVFLDVGAGKGRAMLLATEYSFRRIVGVELHPALAAAARENVEKFLGIGVASGVRGGVRTLAAKSAAKVGHVRARGQEQGLALQHKAPGIRVEEADAMRLRMPAGPCCVFLFNPFGLVLMDRFLDKLLRDFAGREGDLDVVYVNDEQRDLILDEHPRFEEVWRGRIFLSHEDRDADKAMIRYWADGLYVTTGYEDCSMWRLRPA